MNLDVSYASYHVRELKKLGFLELVDEKKRLGAIEHFYRSIARATITEPDWNALPLKAREDISCILLRNIFGEAYSAIASGSLDARLERHITWRSMNLDLDGWQELTELLLRTYYEIEEIQARSDGRRVESGEEGHPFVASIMGFERSPTVPWSSPD
jgi:hypothetical protein